MTSAPFSLRPDNLYFRSSEAGVACPETSQRWKLDQILEIGQSYIATRARGDRARPPIPTDRARNHHLRGDRAEKTWVRTVWSGRVGTGAIWSARRTASRQVFVRRRLRAQREPVASALSGTVTLPDDNRDMRGIGLCPPTVLPVFPSSPQVNPR